MNRLLDCPCQEPIISDPDDPISALTRIRAQCPALSKVFFPDGIYEEFRTAYHDAWTSLESVIVGALRSGCLHRVTSPVHRFLLDGNSLRQDFQKGYLSDLQEVWPVEMRDTKRLFRKSKMFIGKLVELQIAEFLADQGWQVHGLEALGAASDVEATSPDGVPGYVEAKYVGQPEENFDQSEEALRGEPSARSYSSAKNTDYLIWIAYQAARQLPDVAGQRTVCLAMERMNRWNYDRVTVDAWTSYLQWVAEKRGETGITEPVELRMLMLNSAFIYGEEYSLCLPPL